jgi:two-component system, sensor histidine kinase and response regulator
MDKLLSEPLKGNSILIVDDNPQNLQVLGRLLQEKQCEIEFATNGPAALEWLESRKFDLILLDINMPEMDGFEVCKRIRTMRKCDNIPVIFLSADNDRDSILKGFELGGQDFVTKPFDSRELIVRVKTHIALKESLEKLAILNRSLEEKVKERTAELHDANINLERMNARLMELDNAKSEFLNLISHEIRTPLNGIILPVEMLKDSVSPAEMKDLIDILDSSVRRLENFAFNALLITRLKTRKEEIKKQDLDIEELMDQIIDRAGLLISEKHLKIVRVSGLRGSQVKGDHDLLIKCIGSLFDNAVKFSPENGEIEIKMVEETTGLSVEISDIGPGIPKDVMEKGAELFSRGRAYDDNSTGIGIPLALLIAEAHGCTITLSNRPEGGANVKILFPDTIR